MTTAVVISLVHYDSCRNLIGSQFFKQKRGNFHQQIDGGHGPVFGHGRTPCFTGYGVLVLFCCVFDVVLCILHMIP